MNVALVLRRYTRQGGTENYAVELSRFLEQRGHEVHIYAAEVDSSLLEGRQLHVHALEATSEAQMARAARSVPLDAHDVVQGFGRSDHHHIYRAGGGVHAAWLDRRYRGWAGRARLGLDPNLRREVALDRRAQLGAERVIYNSQMALDQAVQRYGLLPSRGRVVRNGVDTERFAPDPEARRAFRDAHGIHGRMVLFLGSGYRRKGLAVAGQAFARVCRSQDRLVVVGRDRHAQRHLAPLRALLGDKLLTLGESTFPERALAAADASLLPTLYDSAANTTLEAMATAVPPVTSVWDGNHELVPDDALIARDPLDAKQVARCLEHALQRAQNDDLRAVAQAWPVSRNGLSVEQLYLEHMNGR